MINKYSILSIASFFFLKSPYFSVEQHFNEDGKNENLEMINNVVFSKDNIRSSHHIQFFTHSNINNIFFCRKVTQVTYTTSIFKRPEIVTIELKEEIWKCPVGWLVCRLILLIKMQSLVKVVIFRNPRLALTKSKWSIHQQVTRSKPTPPFVDNWVDVDDFQ